MELVLFLLLSPLTFASFIIFALGVVICFYFTEKKYNSLLRQQKDDFLIIKDIDSRLKELLSKVPNNAIYNIGDKVYFYIHDTRIDGKYFPSKVKFGEIKTMKQEYNNYNNKTYKLFVIEDSQGLLHQVDEDDLYLELNKKGKKK